MEFLKIQQEIDYSLKKYKLTRKIEDIFLNFGYINMEPSIFEDYDDFISINKRLNKQAMAKVINGDSGILILRPDITTNIIKNLMPRWEDDMKLKLFYNSSVFKNNINSDIREIRQMGIEFLGENSLKADLEVIEIAFSILKGYDEKFILELGTSKYMDGLLKEMNLTENEKEEFKNLIDTKNKNEISNFISDLEVKKEIKELISEILNLKGSMKEVIKKAESNYMNLDMKNAIEELKEFTEIIEEYQYLNYIYLDLSMVSELDYYDGLIFKGYYEGLYREIISGGRYDSLTEVFGKRVPAVGFSIDVDAMISVCYKDGE